MRTVYACLFDVKPLPLETPAVTTLHVWDTVRHWIENHYRTAGNAGFTIPEAEGAAAPQPGHDVAVAVLDNGPCELRTLDWRHPDPDDATLLRIVSFQLARNGKTIEAACTIRIVSTQSVIKPFEWHVDRPAWLDNLFDAFPCYVGTLRIQKTPLELDRDTIELFAEETLCNPARTLPCVLVSPEQGMRDFVVPPEKLQHALLGYAQVYALRDHDTGFGLTACLGRKELSCYLGACRLYWPGFSRKDEPKRHPLYMADTLRKHREDGRPLEAHLFRVLVGIAGFRFGQPPIAQFVRDFFEHEKKERVRQLFARVQNDQDMRDILGELERAWDDTDKLRQERDLARTELAELSRSVETLTAELTEKEEKTGKPRHAKVIDAVTDAKQHFTTTLMFLPSALQSAAESPYRQAEKVFTLLQALDESVRQWQQNGSLGKTWHDTLKGKGFEYKEFISETTLNKYGNEYTFPYDGKPLLCQHHVTMGSGNPNTCLSIHWARDEKNKRLVVGWIGRHRTNTLS